MPDQPSNAGPIAGGILGIFALIGVVVTLLRPSPPPLTQQVDEFLDKAQAMSPQERHADVAARLQEIQDLVKDPQFAKLAAEKQASVRAHLQELQQFQEYTQKLDEITPPARAARPAQLSKIKDSLLALKAPEEHQQEWSKTEAGERQQRWLNDIDAIDKAVATLEKSYRELKAEGDKVIKESEKANLVERAKKILERARALPAPESHASKMIPQSADVTYETVFAFPAVDYAYDKWKVTRATLEKIVKELGKT